jgi:hypothetical protein
MSAWTFTGHRARPDACDGCDLDNGRTFCHGGTWYTLCVTCEPEYGPSPSSSAIPEVLTRCGVCDEPVGEDRTTDAGWTLCGPSVNGCGDRWEVAR